MIASIPNSYAFFASSKACFSSSSFINIFRVRFVFIPRILQYSIACFSSSSLKFFA